MPSSRGWQVAAAAWAGTILVTGMLPTQGAVAMISDGHDDLATVLGHFASYALLGFLLGVALGGWRTKRDRVLLTLALAAGIGGMVELVQIPLPYRDGQVVDVVVNIAGAAVGLVVVSVVESVRRPRSRRG